MDGEPLFALREKKIGRPFAKVCVDEVDNLLVDTLMNSARLAYPAEYSFEWVYHPLLDFVRQQGPAHVPIVADIFLANFFLKSRLGVEFHAKIDGLPLDEVQRWLTQAREVLFRKHEDIDYVLTSDKGDPKIKVITLADFKNTGRIMHGCRLSHGGHEFLEAKHQLPIQKESLTPAALSNACFYSFYDTIYGLSGTLGGEELRSEIESIYGIGSFDVPPHFPSKRIDHGFTFYPSRMAQEEDLLKKVDVQHQRGRPLLVVSPNILDTQRKGDLLRRHGYSVNILNDLSPEQEVKILEEAGNFGQITIATTIATRGADIKPAAQCLAGGGLHTIGTFYPETQQVEDQTCGRAGRQGQPGSSEFLVCVDDLPISVSKDRLDQQKILEDLRLWRQESAERSKKARKARAEYERFMLPYFIKFSDSLLAFKTAAKEGAFQRKIVDALSPLKFKSSLQKDFSRFLPKDFLIATTCFKLLSDSIREKARWEQLTHLVVKRAEEKAIQAWSLDFHHRKEDDFDGEPLTDQQKMEWNAKFDEKREGWEKYLDSNGKGVLLLLSELMGIQFINMEI